MQRRMASYTDSSVLFALMDAVATVSNAEGLTHGWSIRGLAGPLSIQYIILAGPTLVKYASHVSKPLAIINVEITTIVSSYDPDSAI